jgi:hypothetical protein
MDFYKLRTTIYNVYATEYLGFLTAAVLLGLRSSGRSTRVAMLLAITGGLALSLLTEQSQNAWRPMYFWRSTWDTARQSSGEYRQAVAFSECAVGRAPALATAYGWSAYARAPWSVIRFDQGVVGMFDGLVYGPDLAAWERVETLVSPVDATRPGSLANFPHMSGRYDVSRYAALIDRLPLQVTAGGWRYLGGQRLADCAARYGYPVTKAPPGSARLLPQEAH